jgi:hypothetical protein
MPVDLRAAVEQVSREHFGGTLHPHIKWGVAPKAVQRRGKFICSTYEASKYLITMHPMFKNPRVPRGVVLYLIYHELLHIAWGTVKHTRQFQEADRSHPDYWRVDKWLGNHLVNLARECGRRK